MKRRYLISGLPQNLQIYLAYSALSFIPLLPFQQSFVVISSIMRHNFQESHPNPRTPRACPAENGRSRGLARPARFRTKAAPAPSADTLQDGYDSPLNNRSFFEYRNSPVNNCRFFLNTVNNGWLSDVPADADNDGIIRLFGGIRQPDDQYEQVHFLNSGKNQPGSSIGPALGRAETKQSTQQYSQIEPGDMDDVTLLNIFEAA